MSKEWSPCISSYLTSTVLQNQVWLVAFLFVIRHPADQYESASKAMYYDQMKPFRWGCHDSNHMFSACPPCTPDTTSRWSLYWCCWLKRWSFHLRSINYPPRNTWNLCTTCQTTPRCTYDQCWYSKLVGLCQERDEKIDGASCRAFLGPKDDWCGCTYKVTLLDNFIFPLALQVLS